MILAITCTLMSYLMAVLFIETGSVGFIFLFVIFGFVALIGIYLEAVNIAAVLRNKSHK